jgi:hypothetical protein
MEYLKLTNGKVTIKVIDQNNPEYATWAFEVVLKEGNNHFKHLTSGVTLESAVEQAVKEFKQITSFAV